MLPREDHGEQRIDEQIKGDSDITANDGLEEISALGLEMPGPTARTWQVILPSSSASSLVRMRGCSLALLSG